MAEQEKTKKAAPTLQPKKQEEKTKKTPWTLQRCKKVARRYPDEEQWKYGAPSSYKAAYAKGWTKECLSVIKSSGQVTKIQRTPQKQHKKVA